MYRNQGYGQQQPGATSGPASTSTFQSTIATATRSDTEQSASDRKQGQKLGANRLRVCQPSSVYGSRNNPDMKVQIETMARAVVGEVALIMKGSPFSERTLQLAR